MVRILCNLGSYVAIIIVYSGSLPIIWLRLIHLVIDSKRLHVLGCMPLFLVIIITYTTKYKNIKIAVKICQVKYDESMMEI